MGRGADTEADGVSTGTSDPEAVQWHPITLLQNPRPQSPTHSRRKDDGDGDTGFALIVLNQPITHYLGIIRQLWNNAFTHIAADGGANCLYEAAGLHGDRSFDNLRVIIGDLDSLSDEARAYFESQSSPSPSSPNAAKTVVIHDPDQYSTDFGKAITYVRDQHATPVDIVAIGGLGGRVDQGMSQLHHLYTFQSHPRYDEGRMYLFSGESLTFLLKAGHHQIRVREEGKDDVFAKYVGILPVKEPSRITTQGLEWDVTDWETEFGGQLSTSNHVLPETKVVDVRTTKDVLFTIALRQI